MLIATAISAGLATTSIILSIVGWANYEPEEPAESSELSLSFAPVIGPHDASVVVVGGF